MPALGTLSEESWAQRAADQSPTVVRSRARGVEQATVIVQAAERLIRVKGAAFTVKDLVSEAGIALKTFYRVFPGRDQLILAIIENMVGEACGRFSEAAHELDDPIARLRYYVTSVVEELGADGNGAENARFVTAEHWRLQSLYPREVAIATRPFTDLLRMEIEGASQAGLLADQDPVHTAWFVTQLAMAVFHFHAFAEANEDLATIAERLWEFCLGGIGGRSVNDR